MWANFLTLLKVLFSPLIKNLQVSGISTEIFRQIETVENDHDATTAAALEAVDRRGEMVVRMLDARHMGRAAQEAVKRFLMLQVIIFKKKMLETAVTKIANFPA